MRCQAGSEFKRRLSIPAICNDFKPKPRKSGFRPFSGPFPYGLGAIWPSWAASWASRRASGTSWAYRAVGLALMSPEARDEQHHVDRQVDEPFLGRRPGDVGHLTGIDEREGVAEGLG